MTMCATRCWGCRIPAVRHKPLVEATIRLMSDRMKSPMRYGSHAIPMMMARLTLASWETIMRRTIMMAQGTCSPAEYRRMTAEKIAATRQSFAALAKGHGHAASLAPFVNRSRANAKRLRRQP